MFYKLEDRQIIACSAIETGEWMRTADRHVDYTSINGHEISTVFLGVDHNHTDEGDPILFETGIFNDDNNMIEMKRYLTWEQATKGHKEFVKKYSD